MEITYEQPRATDRDIRLLHVEDDPDFRDLTRTILKQEASHISVDTAETPDVGLTQLREGSYDCIVSDYDMPERNGLEFLELVREVYPELPFILFTGKGSEEIASEAISSGVTDYLQKTGNLSQYTVLVNRIENAVERYRSTAALEASERRLSLMVEQSPLGVIEWTDEFEFARLNDAAVDILGYTEAELVGNSWEAIVPESDSETVATVVDELLDVKGGFHSINENVRQDGERIICEWHNHSVTDENGNVVAIYSQFQDITDRREQRQQYETLLDNLPGFVYRHRDEPGYPLEFIRGSVESVTGYTAEELATDIEFAEDIIHPEDREYVDTETDTQLEERGRYDLTYRILTRDDEIRWIWERGAAIEDPVTGVQMLEGFISDVTERKQHEEELTRTTARLRALFEESPDMINIHDTAGNIIDPNPQLCEKTGYTEEELTSMKVWDLDSSVDPDEVVDFWEEMEPGDRLRSEGLFECRDGSTVPVEVHVRCLEMNGDSQFVAMSRDITDRRSREQSLTQQQAVLSTMLDNLPVGVLVEDESRQVLASNERFHELLDIGAPPEAIVGSDCEQLAQRGKSLFADPAGFIETTEEKLDSRTPVSGEELLLADGRLLQRAYVPYELPSGNANLWMYSEVTEDRKRQQLLNGLFEQSLEGIGLKEIITDEDGVPVDYVYKRINTAFEELTGLDSEEVVGKRATEVIDGIEETPFISVFGEVGLEGTTARFEQYSEPLGKHYEISVFSPRQGQVITIFSDITDRKEREQALRRERDRLDEFAAVLSHDLRNPLNVAGLRLDLAREECASSHLEDVEVALDRIKTLVEDLLVLARKGEVVSDIESVALRELAEDCWQNVETTSATFVVEDDCTVQADRSRLKQLLENLIRNAIEHGATEKSEHSDTEQPDETGVTVTVGALDDGFYFEDNGPGIPEADRKTVFDVGYSTHSEGTGFGLAIVRQIATAHGWDIRVSESADGGARFEITGVECFR